jgi:predicted kinase
MRLIEEALTEGRSVVVDNTNPTVEDRAPIIALTRRYGAEVVG